MQDNQNPIFSKRICMEIIYTIYYLVLGRHKLARRKRRKIAKARFDQALDCAPHNSIVFDCGANYGSFTSLFLDRGFQVYAFEPDPLAAEGLIKRFGNHPKLKFHPVAVGAKKSRTKLFRAKEFDTSPEYKTISSSLLVRKDGDQDNYVEVDVINLLEYIETIPGQIAIMKIDIEGTEVEILEELIRNGMHRKIDFIFVETHERISFGIAFRTARLRAKIHVRGLDHINLDHT